MYVRIGTLGCSKGVRYSPLLSMMLLNQKHIGIVYLAVHVRPVLLA